MQKRRFYFILTILTIISLFSFAAICNQCGADTEDKIGIGEDEASEEEIPTDSEEETEVANEDNTSSEEEADEADSEEETDTDAEAEGDTEAPAISLAIYQGPTLEESICYYRIEATVTGSPNPTVSFSKDDSGGAWLPNRVQVNLNDPGDTYTLTATATNSEGSATDSITLSWGCEEPEPEPEPEPEVHETTIDVTQEISGYIWDDGTITQIPYAFLGDSDIDTYTKGYFSFDISGLHGKNVQDAELRFTSIQGYGFPSTFASEIVVKVFNYIRLDASDFALGGVQLPSIPISAAHWTIGGNTLKVELQSVLDNEVRDYFQLKLGLNATTNNDGFADAIKINWIDALLYISYTD